MPLPDEGFVGGADFLGGGVLGDVQHLKIEVDGVAHWQDKKRGERRNQQQTHTTDGLKRVKTQREKESSKKEGNGCGWKGEIREAFIIPGRVLCESRGTTDRESFSVWLPTGIHGALSYSPIITWIRLDEPCQISRWITCSIILYMSPILYYPSYIYFIIFSDI